MNRNNPYLVSEVDALNQILQDKEEISTLMEFLKERHSAQSIHLALFRLRANKEPKSWKLLTHKEAGNVG